MSSNVREVVLEILRYGEAHNQLLSPLTQYLALCGSHPAVSLYVPFEHRELQHLLSQMGYEEGMEEAVARDRAFARERLARTVTEFLGRIPALPHEARVRAGELLHLRLMMTPQELATLPFELANPPSGFENGGQPLLIGPTPDVVLTREVRRTSATSVRVPPKPRILLVAADPERRGIPFDANRAAIAQALSPWVRPSVQDGTLAPDLDAHFVVLPQASLDEVREHCETGGFTHVHVLAHGGELNEPNKDGFGLVLWNRQKDGPEVVDGPTLARALRPPSNGRSWASPWCVVLCTCESGNIGGVVHPTASLAHNLHIAGIPFVLASQYPLTFGAANTLAATLYPLELAGEDPRRTLRNLRHAIASNMRRTHDWASLVAYAGWPTDLVRQLEEIRIVRIFAQLEAAQDWADHVIARADQPDEAGIAKEVLDRSLELVNAAATRLQIEVKEKELEREEIGRQYALNEISKHEKQHRVANVTALLTELYGLLGSAAKRCARLYSHAEQENKAKQTLREATRWYRDAFALRAPEHWTACQAFVLLSLGCKMGWAGEPEKKSASELWRHAADVATRELKQSEERPWALGTLIEVELWRPELGREEESDKVDESHDSTDAQKAKEHAEDLVAAERATGHLQDLIAEAGADSFEVKSTVRQLRRYSDWWGEAKYLDESMRNRVAKVFARVMQQLPAATNVQPPLEIILPERLNEACDSVIMDQVLGSGKVVSVRTSEDSSPGDVFSVQMLPAHQGDSLWVEYGTPEDTHRILIDGGVRTTIRTVETRIRDLAAASTTGKCHFDLGVVSHIDADHIEGFVEVLGADLPVSFGDLWFNGRKHIDLPPIKPSLNGEEFLNGKHGLFLDTALELTKTNWNRAFNCGVIVVPPSPAKLPVAKLPGGMKITIMSPSQPKLAALAGRWDAEVRDAGLMGSTYKQVLQAMDRLHFSVNAFDDSLLGRKKPSGPIDIKALLQEPDGTDNSVANGSSIAFLAEYAGRSCLFMADAHPDVIIEAIDRRAGNNKRLAVGAVKLSHHGSGNNVTLDFLRRIDSQVFLVSTSGRGHYHPDRHAMAKLVAGDWRPRKAGQYSITILFNYRSEYTKIWDDEDLKQRHHYSVEYANPGDILELSVVPKTPVER